MEENRELQERVEALIEEISIKDIEVNSLKVRIEKLFEEKEVLA